MNRSSRGEDDSGVRDIESRFLEDRAQTLNRWLGVLTGVAAAILAGGVLIQSVAVLTINSLREDAKADAAEIGAAVNAARVALSHIQEGAVEAGRALEKVRNDAANISKAEGSERASSEDDFGEFLELLDYRHLIGEAGRLRNGETERHSVELEGGVEAVFSADCGSQGCDLDLRLLDSSDAVVAQDELTDPVPIVAHMPDTDGVYVVEVVMYACESPDGCEWGLEGYADAGWQ